MRRVSTNMPNDDMQYRLRRQEEALMNMQSKIGSQKRINELRDDPLAASHTVRYESRLARLERFEKNTLYAQDHYNQIDIYLQRSVDVMQRIRELSVQGANGIYSREDLRNMAVEVNELMAELVSIANASGPDGNRLFAGDKAFTEPFRIVEGTIQGGPESMIVQVEYRGAGPSRYAEISDGTYTSLDIGGGEAFWAEKMQVFSNRDSSAWRATSEGAFYVDGREISVSIGDTLPAIVAKINDSHAPVKAYIDPESRGISLEGTNPHLIRLDDKQGSNVLEELGLIQANNDPSAPNWNPGARVSGGSVFDMVIRLRDALFRGDQDFTGSQGIGGIDLALQNLETSLANVGSKQERASMAWHRLNDEIPNTASYIARESALDMTTAAMELANMDFAHKAALQTAARIIPPTLLDFLR
ncbi:MAG: flagellar hook-associated protein 3 [Treponema sp.]|jgi:flagellar hook-associated protein 3 FlgL|nr:flagellar hook-associated protein 3 [Treponema sp.]